MTLDDAIARFTAFAAAHTVVRGREIGTMFLSFDTAGGGEIQAYPISPSIAYAARHNDGMPITAMFESPDDLLAILDGRRSPEWKFDDEIGPQD